MATTRRPPGSGEDQGTSPSSDPPIDLQAEVPPELSFEDLLDGAPDALVLTDADGRLLMVNRQTEELFGWTRDELVGRQVEVLLPQRYREAHLDHRLSYMEDPSVRPMGAGLELSGVRKDGSEFPVEISLSPISTASGVLVMAAVRDITDREQAEQRFHDLLEAAPDAMVLVDAGGEITLVNRQTEELFGWTREEVVGQPVEVLVPEKYRDGHVDHRLGFMEDPSVRPMGAGLELSGVRKDGSEFPVEISLAPIQTDRGPQALAAIRDMTEREQVKRELRRYAERLERSNQEWEQFAHVVSHDLQEPIRMVISYVQLLERRLEDQLDDETREYVGYAVEGAQRMQKLIRALLTFSRVDTRGAGLDPVDADRVLEGALDSLRVQLEENGATVNRGDLPVVLADEAQLAQVFQNLISNAVKFHRPGVPPEIEVRARREDGMWHFEVEDNGIGLDPEQGERIFVIFQRLHARDAYEGEGIGLAVCKKIIERHGGRIWVEAAPGEGSVFHFTLQDATGPGDEEDPPGTSSVAPDEER